jgi:hypothetical protein
MYNVQNRPDPLDFENERIEHVVKTPTNSFFVTLSVAMTKLKVNIVSELNTLFWSVIDHR